MNLMQKHWSDIFSKLLMEVWNTQLVQNKIFPNNLTVANITPIFKKGYSTLEKNYRPVSILPVASKMLENKYLITSKSIYHDTYVDIERDLIPNTLLLKIRRKL